MTKRLEDLLGLPEASQMLQDEKKYARERDGIIEKKMHALEEEGELADQHANFDKITEDLPVAHGLGNMADKELDNVANKAMKAYDDLMDLGMNIEIRYAGRIFEVAGTMLKTSLDAKVAKVNKKLKMLELQMRKEKDDKTAIGDGDIIENNGVIVTDRNSIIEQLKGLKKDK